MAIQYYLHYQFSNSGLSIIDFEEAKRAALETELSRYRKINQAKINRDKKADEVMDLLGDGEHDDLALDLATAISMTSSSASGIGTLSYQELSKLGKNPAAITKAVLKTIESDLERSAIKTQKALDLMMTSLSSVYPDAVNYAIHEAASLNKSLSSEELLHKTLFKEGQLVIPKESFSAAEKTLITCFIKAQSAINAIPGAEAYAKANKIEGVSSKKIEGQLVSLLLGKVGGTLNNLSGLADKYANSIAQQKADNEVSDALEKLKSALGKDFQGKNFSVTKKETNDFPEKSPVPKGSQQTSNSSFKYSADKVEIKYEGDVKPLHKEGSGFSEGQIAIFGYEANLSNLLNRVAVSKYYIESLATGMQDKNGESLQAGWRSLVDYAVTLGFIDYIKPKLGNGQSATYVVVNDHLTSLGEIVNKLILNPDTIEYTGGKQRSKFWQQNIWLGGSPKNTYLAQLRSKRIERDVQETFHGTLIRAKLASALLNL